MISLSRALIARWHIVCLLKTDTIENSPCLTLLKFSKFDEARCSRDILWQLRQQSRDILVTKLTVTCYLNRRLWIYFVIIRSLPLRNTICFRLKIKSLILSYEVDLKLYIYRTSDWRNAYLWWVLCLSSCWNNTRIDLSRVTNFLAMHLIHQDFSLEDDSKALRVYLSNKGC